MTDENKASRPPGTLNARLSQQDPRLYNVSRDVAHAFGDMMRVVASRLESLDRWPVLKAFIEENDITEDQLGEACAAFIRFTGGACDDPKEEMGDVLRRSGWYDRDKVPEEAHIAIMAMLGTVISGYFFTGAREVTMENQGPCSTMQDLRDAGWKSSKLIMGDEDPDDSDS